MVEILHARSVDGEPLQVDMVVCDGDHSQVVTSADDRRPGAFYGDRGVWVPVPRALDVFVVLRTEGNPSVCVCRAVSQQGGAGLSEVASHQSLWRTTAGLVQHLEN